jgi:hypothetical protein
MKQGDKYYAKINCLFNLNEDSKSLILSLREDDARKIKRVLKGLRCEMAVVFSNLEMEMMNIDVFLDDEVRIKIVNEQLYVQRNDVLEFLIDENNLVRDIVFRRAIKKNYDVIRKIMRLIYPPNTKPRKMTVNKPLKRREKIMYIKMDE